MMTKRLAVILIDSFAEWEFGLLTSVARDYLGAEVTFHTPGGRTVTAEGGLRAEADGAIEDLNLANVDALVVVGSSHWSKGTAPDLNRLLQGVDESGRTLGFICQGTLAAARAGMLNERAHTSNNLETLKKAAVYRGSEHYVDTPRAVRDGNIITAPGSAPVTFAIEMLNALWPEKAGEIGAYHADLVREHQKA
jgi:putative intracellular protease/amidase